MSSEAPPDEDSRFMVPFLRGRHGRGISRGQLFWLLQAVGWSAFALMSFGYALAGEGVAPALFDVATLIVTGVALTSLYRHPYRRWRERGVPPVGLGLRIVGMCTLGIVLWWEAQAVLGHAAYRFDPALVPWMPSYTRVPLDALYLWGPVLLGWSFLYFGINDWISLQLERRRSAAAEASAQAARFRALQSQLQPHFLFNALNSIASLVLDGRGDAAVTMIARVGEFLRLSLQTQDVAKVTLERELTFIRYYLDIEQMRFGDRLRPRFEIAEEARTALVPTLLLQPLVENAVRHGILPRASGGSVTIAAAVQGGVLTLRVEDDGAGFGGADAPTPGIGLSNTARRLEQLYGDAGRLSVGRGAERGVVIDIELPLQRLEDPPT